MNNSNKCPRCGAYFFGYYCCSCKQDIRCMEKKNKPGDMPDFMKKFFGDNRET